jgi:hypothetical protein
MFSVESGVEGYEDISTVVLNVLQAEFSTAHHRIGQE